MTFEISTAKQVEITTGNYIDEIFTLYNVTKKANNSATSNLFNIDETSSLLSKEMAEQFHSRVAKAPDPG